MLVAEYDEEEEGNVDDNGCHGQYKLMGINVSHFNVLAIVHTRDAR